MHACVHALVSCVPCAKIFRFLKCLGLWTWMFGFLSSCSPFPQTFAPIRRIRVFHFLVGGRHRINGGTALPLLWTGSDEIRRCGARLIRENPRRSRGHRSGLAAPPGRAVLEADVRALEAASAASEAEKGAGGGIDECMLSAARTKACMQRWSISARSHAFFTAAWSL